MAEEASDKYEDTWTHTLWEFARLPGVVATGVGLFALMTPVGWLALAVGIAEMAAVTHFDLKASDKFDMRIAAKVSTDSHGPSPAVTAVRVDDGTILAGISPDKHKPMNTTLADAPLSPIHVYAGANESPAKSEPQIGPEIGAVMPAGHPNAGWIYAGISNTTQEPFYVAPKDSGVFQWKEAMAFAAKEGSRLPSKDELDQICDAKDKGALKDTFDPAGWYWSSLQSSNDSLAWAQHFSDGGRYDYYKYLVSSLRCVR